MKVRVPMTIQDPLTTRVKGMQPTEDFYSERHFLDGPISERVAVLDFPHQLGRGLGRRRICCYGVHRLARPR